MKHTLQKIVFFGTEDFSLESLKLLVENDFNIAAVITKPDSASGRGQVVKAPNVKRFAQSHGIDVWQPENLDDVAVRIKNLGNNVLGVLVSYGKIIPNSIIDLFKPGIVNVHPSLLPKWRGPSPIEAAIKNGDNETGVSIMLISDQMDAGPIYSQIPHTLTGKETRPELYNALAKKGANLLVETLPDIINGSLQPKPQQENLATYCGMLKKEHSFLEFDAVSALEAERIVRGHLGFPKTKIQINGHIIIITKSHVSYSGEEPLVVKCRDGIYLAIDELIAPSGKTMTSAAFLRGYKTS